MPDGAPLVLAFDTSAAHCAAALLCGDRILSEVRKEMDRGQAERLLPLCADLLRAEGRTLAELDAIGVGVGPGNFTGIRIAVSAARGLALGLGIPAVGVSAFEALRFGHDGPCACAVAAPRGMVYVQVYGADGLRPPVLVGTGDFPRHDGPLIGAGGQPPVHGPAASIAHVARARFETETARPAPLYLRPADAAPARDLPPEILP
ncbi:tRNA (adenosine(37)-N6)-threonylcarbamoyltransferase complex dimerization subunit type 1 TsaB [Sulfitobacter sp. D35]|uniref:tRNA (adenosine(37)-N6)-threonylcarbamoyltransferase complex dimerization subunit type 1 TsaB n=1 Tax=Sulfitobacter sp. D35 TaxID=3083252 RepID=UPI00296F5217|nr:tRNA (adenosine(37)-N6)-threonylcarbamoyltransferase complex dimerization subunit type 1 TsaB [Sulfitobacter sp. D35]MDW4499097.1 tRNA (adenosine(37)-N6)-threonylcarbamoyltransferase complex dimerization subunit type 1 TsaB [Sulfitobacter sp. D35]